jgi:hypothetical protein
MSVNARRSLAVWLTSALILFVAFHLLDGGELGSTAIKAVLVAIPGAIGSALATAYLQNRSKG